MLSDKLLIIAEVAQSHDGSLGMAHAFIDASAKAGANAIKFQTHIASEESTPQEPWRVHFSTQDKSRYDYWERMEFTPDQWLELANHARARNLLFISSPFSVKAVEILERAGVDIYKVASGEINNKILMDEISATRKAIILSTGMSPFTEIDNAVESFTKKGCELAVLQCTSEYPVKPENLGLNLIREYKARYNLPVGLSDHSGNIFSGLASIALGADLLEVHVTFSKDMFGPDVPASITFEELSLLSDGAHWIKKAIMNPVDKDQLANNFNNYRSIFMKSFVASEDIPKGTVITINHIKTKKPCIGIPASNPEQIIGKIAGHLIKRDSFIMNDDLL